MFISPEGYGYIDCKESGEYMQDKEIVIRTESPMPVSTLYLSDNFEENISVTINGKNILYTNRLGLCERDSG